MVLRSPFSAELRKSEGIKPGALNSAFLEYGTNAKKSIIITGGGHQHIKW